jgi:hypothetical protein
MDALLTSVRTAVEAVREENRELRVLLAAFAEPARRVLEAVDRFAEAKGEKAVEPAPAPAHNGKTPAPRATVHIDTPSDETVAEWAAQMDRGTRAGFIGKPLGLTPVQVGTYVRNWRERQQAKREQAPVEAAPETQTITVVESPTVEVETPPFWQPSASTAGPAGSF